jgi:hypothetical protein
MDSMIIGLSWDVRDEMSAKNNHHYLQINVLEKKIGPDRAEVFPKEKVEPRGIRDFKNLQGFPT